MKKKLIIALLIVLIVSLPLFAKTNKKTKVVEPIKETTSTSNTTTAPVSQPVESVPTSISTPIYKVELTEAQYITQEDVDSAVEYLTSYYGQQISDEQATEYLINQILLNQALVRAIESNEIPLYDGQFNDYVSYQLALYASYYGINLTTNEEAEAFLSQLGITLEDFANSVLQDYAQEYYIQLHSKGRLEAVTPPTNDEVKAFYEENKNLFVSSECVQLSHIFFAFGEDKNVAKVKANTAVKNINKGLSFEDAVKTYSEDETTKTDNGAFGIWIFAEDPGVAESFGETAAKEIFKLKVGKVSDAIEGVAGYHIFKVTDRMESKNLALTDLYNPNFDYTVADVIAQELYNNAQTVAYATVLDEIMASLEAEAVIKSLK